MMAKYNSIILMPPLCSSNTPSGLFNNLSNTSLGDGKFVLFLLILVTVRV
jgi:hypothetical protein